MGDDRQPAEASGASRQHAWHQPLFELEQLLIEAGRAVASLRSSLEQADREAAPPSASAPLVAWPARRATAESISPAEVPPPPLPAAAQAEARLPAEPSTPRATFERLWERIDHEKLEKQVAGPPEAAARHRGLDLLPQQYVVTVEDREGLVDLVPLHRAFLGLAKMEDISLVSFANGVPVISLRVEGGLELERLESVVATVLDRHCQVIEQGSGKLYLRLSARQDGGG